MRIDVTFTPGELGTLAVGGRTAVVLDVLRATTTVVHALANGARRVIPVRTVEEAVAKRTELGRDAALLCGERGTKPIPGFDLGNSPLEFTPEAVGDRALIMTTTNGTPALLAAAAAENTLIGSFLNAEAVTRRMLDLGNDVLIVCSGREGRFALEDAYCAGVLVQRARALRRKPLRLDDGARAALMLAGRTGGDPRSTLQRSAAGRALRDLGQGEDVLFCATLDLHDAVPVFEHHRIELS